MFQSTGIEVGGILRLGDVDGKELPCGGAATPVAAVQSRVTTTPSANASRPTRPSAYHMARHTSWRLSRPLHNTSPLPSCAVTRIPADTAQRSNVRCGRVLAAAPPSRHAQENLPRPLEFTRKMSGVIRTAVAGTFGERCDETSPLHRPQIL